MNQDVRQVVFIMAVAVAAARLQCATHHHKVSDGDLNSDSLPEALHKRA
jgi:hypothetical protein